MLFGSMIFFMLMLCMFMFELLRWVCICVIMILLSDCLFFSSLLSECVLIVECSVNCNLWYRCLIGFCNWLNVCSMFVQCYVVDRFSCSVILLCVRIFCLLILIVCKCRLISLIVMLWLKCQNVDVFVFSSCLILLLIFSMLMWYVGICVRSMFVSFVMLCVCSDGCVMCFISVVGSMLFCVRLMCFS